MKRKRKALSMIMAAALAAGTLVPVNAEAAETDYAAGMELTKTTQGTPDSYDLWVGGVQVTSENLMIDETDNNVVEGTALYDPETNTLTLNDFIYSGPGYSNAAIYTTGQLNIVVDGNENRVTHTNTSGEFSYGICAGNLTITGMDVENDNITVESGSVKRGSQGIYALELSISKVTVKATGGSSSEGYSKGISADSITIAAGSVMATSGEAIGRDYLMSCGIESNSNMKISDGAIVTAEGGEASEETLGISVGGEIDISDSIVTAVGGKGEDSFGIFSEDSLIINSGTVRAEGREAENSYGLFSNGNIAIKGGIVTAKGGNGQKESFGLYCWDKTTISGGEITAFGGMRAFYEAPDVVDYTDAKTWYGDSEDVANAQGAQEISGLATNYSNKYIRIAPGVSAPYTIRVSASPADGGFVSGDGVYDENSTVTLTATANEGYKFVKWMENENQVSDNVSYTFVAKANRELVAVFNKVQSNDKSSSELMMELEINEIKQVPERLNGMFDTVAKLKEKLFEKILVDKRYTENNTVFYDLKVKISENNGNTWEYIAKDNFPKKGLTVTLPYPKGTDKDTHDFLIAHMFTTDMNGHKTGDVEHPAVIETDEGLQVTLNGLSPVGVAWRETAKEDVPIDKPDNNVATSDNSNMLPWVLMASVTLMVIIGITVSRKKIK